MYNEFKRRRKGHHSTTRTGEVYDQQINEESNMAMTVSLSNEERKNLLDKYGFPFDRFITEPERRELTAICRTKAWRLLQEGNFPAPIKVGRATRYKLSEILYWNEIQKQQQEVA